MSTASAHEIGERAVHAAHSLHRLRESHEHASGTPPRKADRFLVGVFSGALLFLLIGRALGLGARRPG